MAGLSREEIAELAPLDSERFEPREWVALCWARSFLRENGMPSLAVRERFEKAFEPREQELIKATMKAMFISNLTTNTLRLWLENLRRRFRRAAP